MPPLPGKMLQLLIHHIFHTLSHQRYKVLGAVEETRVEDYETDVGGKLLGVVVARVECIEIWFRGVGGAEFALDG